MLTQWPGGEATNRTYNGLGVFAQVTVHVEVLWGSGISLSDN